MQIKLSPQRLKDSLTASITGDVLTLNGEPFDFSVIPDGATLPAEAVASPWVSGPVERIDGVLHLTLTLPHGANPPPEVAFPAPIIDPPDGELALPRAPEPEPAPIIDEPEQVPA